MDATGGALVGPHQSQARTETPVSVSVSAMSAMPMRPNWPLSMPMQCPCNAQMAPSTARAAPGSLRRAAFRTPTPSRGSTTAGSASRPARARGLAAAAVGCEKSWCGWVGVHGVKLAHPASAVGDRRASGIGVGAHACTATNRMRVSWRLHGLLCAEMTRSWGGSQCGRGSGRGWDAHRG